MKSERIGAVMAGLLCLAAVAHADSSGIGFGPGQSMSVSDALSAAKASKAPDSARIILTRLTDEQRRAAQPDAADLLVELSVIGRAIATADAADLPALKECRRAMLEQIEGRGAGCDPDVKLRAMLAAGPAGPHSSGRELLGELQVFGRTIPTADPADVPKIRQRQYTLLQRINEIAEKNIGSDTLEYRKRVANVYQAMVDGLLKSQE